MGWWFGRMMTFEIAGDESIPSVANVLADASNGLVSCTAPRELAGYAAYGQSIKAAIEPLVDCFAVELFDDGSQLRAAASVVGAVANDDLGNSADNHQVARLQREFTPPRELPGSLRVRYYDPARDYQAGEARASASEQQGSEQQIEVPAALSAGDAKSLAQQMLARAWAQRDRLTISLPPRFLDLEPGTQVDLPLNPARWSVEQSTIEGLAVRLDLKPVWAPTPAIAADAGRIVPASDEVAGAVSIALLDVPALSPNSPTLLLAASSPAPGWKRSRVDLSVVGQSMAVLTAPRKSLLGSAATVLAAADPSSTDVTNSVDVLLIDTDQWLTSCDDAALTGGANLVLLGEELIQFGDVTPLGGGRFRLARLLRGRHGTEGAVSGHVANEVFCLIETGSLQQITLPVASIGTEVTAQVPGGDDVSLTVKPRADAIASPAGGATIDVEARGAIDQILTTMRQHGLIDS